MIVGIKYRNQEIDGKKIKINKIQAELRNVIQMNYF